MTEPTEPTDTTGRAWIGCSGYDYPDWRGRFYPADLPRAQWFGHYASCFDTLELNATFYGLPSEESVRAWRERAPRDFRYAVKLSQFGTHRKHLKDPDQWLGTFLDRVAGLGDTLGPVLVQLPPRWRADPPRLEAFLAAADELTRGPRTAPSGWAIEVRDARWLCPEVYEVLADHRAALVLHDLIVDHPQVRTADWTYLRFHGPDPAQPYGGRYPAPTLDRAARWLETFAAEGGIGYAYFNNDQGAQSVTDAQRLRRRLTAAT